MTGTLSAEEMSALSSLSTIEPTKPELPAPIADHLIEMGLAIALVEGGLQLTELGRERLTQQQRVSPSLSGS
jgi:hypothetical protein